MILTDFKKQLSETIVNSHLSIDAIYFVLKDLLNEVEQLYNIELQKEQTEKDNKEQKEETQK